MLRAKPVAGTSCLAAALESRAAAGQGPKCGSKGSARIGSSGKLSWLGASRFGAPSARSGTRSSRHGFTALSASVLVGVPIGGAATVCA